jgi:orotidine-5'-phosphate decarboxylase
MDSSDLDEIGIAAGSAAQTIRLAELAQRSGIDGMICSSLEVTALRQRLAPGTLLVVPGIRPAGSAVSDQRRVATPASAIRDGASMLVVGRPITGAADPAAAAAAILEEIETANQK